MSETQTSMNELLSSPETRAVLTRFIDNLPEYLRKIKAISFDDRVSLKSAAHQLKGTAACFGLQEISQLASHIEQNAQDLRQDELSGLIGQLETLMHLAKQELAFLTNNKHFLECRFFERVKARSGGKHQPPTKQFF